MIMKGQKINERYQIIKSIGEGGMANVYLAYDTILDRDVAVKILRGDLSNDEKFVRRFQREALNASSLSHPNIVEVYDVGDDNGQYFIVMEYIDGKNLKDLLKKRGKLTLSEVVDIMSQIADGLSVAHDSYIIHRDIKPQNIMILENGLIKITDFGIAMAMNATQLTQTNSVMGSVHYLPPEQASGKGSTLKSDIYSMGILMYELLTGTLPYRGDNAVEIALKHLKEPLPSIREILPDIPQSVENIILKSIAKNPKNRYNDAREMYEDLKTCLDDSRLNEEVVLYEYPELDSDGRKFTKQIEKAVLTEEDNKKINKEDEVSVKQISKDEYKKENKLLIVLAAIFTGLVLIAVVGTFFIKSLLKGNDIKVPDVTGKTINEAVSILQDAGFTIADEQQQVNSELNPGLVVRTNPPVGAKRAPGKEIILYVSVGASTVDIEDYSGRNYSEVYGYLSAFGIHVYSEKREVNLDEYDNLDDNTIIGQSEEAGAKLGEGDNITFYLPDLDILMPDFTTGDYTLEDVEEWCLANGLDAPTVRDEVTGSGKEEGAIVWQSKTAGTRVSNTTKITLDIAKGPVEDEEENEEPEENGLD